MKHRLFFGGALLYILLQFSQTSVWAADPVQIQNKVLDVAAERSELLLEQSQDEGFLSGETVELTPRELFEHEAPSPEIEVEIGYNGGWFMVWKLNGTWYLSFF